MIRRRSRDRLQVVRWQPEELRARLADAMRIYTAAMGYPPETGIQRSAHASAHTRLDGFRAVGALDGTGAAVGFGYGYTSQPGQWWHDQVRAALPASVAEQWLTDSFELCELHVLPDWQGRGVGRALLMALGGLVPLPRMLLSTPEGESRARRLYRSTGFVDLVGHHRFPGDTRPFAVLGARLPFPQQSA